MKPFPQPEPTYQFRLKHTFSLLPPNIKIGARARDFSSELKFFLAIQN